MEQEEKTKKTFENLEQLQRENERLTSNDIDALFFLEKDILALADEIKNIGDKKGIESEIVKLKNEISLLKKTSGMSDDDIKSYNEQIEEISRIKDLQEIYTKDLSFLEKLKSDQYFIDLDLSDLSENFRDTLAKEIKEAKEKFVTEINEKLNNKISEIRRNFSENKRDLDTKNKAIEPLDTKLKKSKALDEKLEKLAVEEKKLKEISSEEKKLLNKKSQHQEIVKRILTTHTKFYDNLFLAKSSILEQRIISGTISFNIEISFKNSSFQKEFIEEICNLRNLNQFENGFLNEYIYVDNATLNSDFKKIMHGILNNELVLKGNYSRQDAVRKLLRNWFIFDYKIEHNGDHLSAMSPGKKSFVLLKLLIELDNSKCPILLDQPEDDLDNRSIYNELVQFIRNKKKERQIIIVTHNPNLVVGADAECVIVANQAGDQSMNKTYKFEYVSGALENTFNNQDEDKILYKYGIQEHVCDILEGGEEAFQQRKNKYNF